MKIVVAMSGGVDSSVAAALLHATGHEVIGISTWTEAMPSAIYLRPWAVLRSSSLTGSQTCVYLGLPSAPLMNLDRPSRVVYSRASA